jgi:hypothetical protein
MQTRVLQADICAKRGFLDIFIRSMAVGRSISARVPHGFEMLADMQLSRQRTAWPCRSSSTAAGQIASEGRCELKWQPAGNWRKAEQTLSQLKDPKWKQFVKRFKGFVKRLGNQKSGKRSDNLSTAMVWLVKAVRLAVPVTGVAVPKVPIWQRRNSPPPPSLELDKVRPSRSRNDRFSIM